MVIYLVHKCASNRFHICVDLSMHGAVYLKGFMQAWCSVFNHSKGSTQAWCSASKRLHTGLIQFIQKASYRLGTVYHCVFQLREYMSEAIMSLIILRRFAAGCPCIGCCWCWIGWYCGGCCCCGCCCPCWYCTCCGWYCIAYGCCWCGC